MKMRKQRLMGLGMVIISAVIVALAMTGETVEDRDATAVLFTLPLGIYAMVTKEYILYDGEEDTSEREHTPTITTKKKGASTWQENALPKPLPLNPGRTSTQLCARSRRPS